MNSKSKKSLIIAIIAVILIAGGAYAFIKVKNDPKTVLVNSVYSLKDEYFKLCDEFTPGFGIKKEFDKFTEDGQLTLKSKIELNSKNGEKAGVNYNFVSNPLSKESQLDFALNYNDMFNAAFNLKAINNDIFFSSPQLSDSTYEIKGSTFGTDLANSDLADMLQINPEDYKNLKLDLFQKPATLKEMRDDYLKYTSKEWNTLSDHMTVETREADKNIDLNKYNKDSDNKINADYYTVKLQGNDIKNLLNKSAEYMYSLQSKQLKSMGLDEIPELKEQLDNERKETEQKIKDLKLPEVYTLNAFIKDGKLIYISFPDTENKTAFNIYLLGDKSTMDNMVIENTENNKTLNTVTLKLTQSDKINTLTLKSDGNSPFEVVSSYNTENQDFDSRISVKENNFEIKGSFENVVEGKSYDFIIKSFTTNLSNAPVDITGKIQVKFEAEKVKKPEKTVEFLKLNENQLKELENNLNKANS